MKRYLFILGAAVVAGASMLGSGRVSVKAETLSLAQECKAAYSCDYYSGTTAFASHETDRLPIASMCKIMTLLLSFEAADRGDLSYDEEICVSENASGMGGSQVFLDSGLSYRAEDLMKSVAVCSANDSCVALAERVAGSEQAFVQRMNDRAKELGAEDTLFANCTGLPKDPQYSCAKDVALMLRELLRHEKYYEFSKIWLEDFAHPDGRTTQITNTNKLIRAYQGCDGGKTGFTNEAGFCLAATAKRGDMRVISVVIGASDSKSRFRQVSELFNDCFANYENKILLSAGECIKESVQVRGSRTKQIEAVAENTLSYFRKRGGADEPSVDICLDENLKAPVLRGQAVGNATLYLNGIEIAKTSLLANGEAKAFTWWEAVQESAKQWQ